MENIVMIASGHSRKISDLMNDLCVPKLFERKIILSNQTKRAYAALYGIGL